MGIWGRLFGTDETRSAPSERRLLRVARSRDFEAAEAAILALGQLPYSDAILECLESFCRWATTARSDGKAFAASLVTGHPRADEFSQLVLLGAASVPAAINLGHAKSAVTALGSLEHPRADDLLVAIIASTLLKSEARRALSGTAHAHAVPGLLEVALTNTTWDAVEGAVGALTSIALPEAAAALERFRAQPARPVHATSWSGKAYVRTTTQLGQRPTPEELAAARERLGERFPLVLGSRPTGAAALKSFLAAPSIHEVQKLYEVLTTKFSKLTLNAVSFETKAEDTIVVEERRRGFRARLVELKEMLSASDTVRLERFLIGQLDATPWERETAYALYRILPKRRNLRDFADLKHVWADDAELHSYVEGLRAAERANEEREIAEFPARATALIREGGSAGGAPFPWRSFEGYGPEVLPHVLPLTTDERWSVRRAAVNILADLRGPGIREAVQRFHDGEADVEISDALERVLKTLDAEAR